MSKGLERVPVYDGATGELVGTILADPEARGCMGVSYPVRMSIGSMLRSRDAHEMPAPEVVVLTPVLYGSGDGGCFLALVAPPGARLDRLQSFRPVPVVLPRRIERVDAA